MNYKSFLPKRINLLLIIILLVAGCGPSPETIATQTSTAATTIAADWTATPTSTSTLAPTPTNTNTPTTTSTPTPTNTPTNTPEPTATPTNTPTDTPEPTATSTNTPTPTVPPGPKSGHWEGTDPSTSFDITNEGVIQNFKLVIPVGPAFNQSTCTITLEEIVLDAGNTFNYQAEPVSGKTGQPPHISGKFNDATTITGEVSFEICGNLITMAISADGTRTVPSWDLSAEWKGP